MNKPKILAFSGSARQASFNQRLVAAAARAAERAGAEVRLVNLRDFPLPIMDQDLEREKGQPENAARLKALMVEHDGFLIASPEYNSSISPLLKNAIDWASRKAGDEPSMVAYQGKAVALLSASPGGLGGLRGLVHLRAIFGNIGVLVLPTQVALRSAASAFDDDGELVNDSDAERVEKLVTEFVALLEKLA